MTFGELCGRMDPLEFREWMALFALEADEQRDREMEARASARASANFRAVR